MSSVRLIHGDAREVLTTLPSRSIHMACTSPPYFGLRNYQVDGQIGLESSPDTYVDELVSIFREVRRVLRDDGTFWLNLGDSYAANRTYQVADSKWTDVGNSRGSRVPSGMKPKDLIGIPWRVAFALQAGFSLCDECGLELRSDLWPVLNGHRICLKCSQSRVLPSQPGWYLRSDIIWAKPNPMPESVTDRPTRSHEYLFLLTKSPRYYYDAHAIREPHTSMDRPPGNKGNAIKGRLTESYGRPTAAKAFPTGGRNKRDVWTITTRPYKGAHFATFPPALVEPCILAGTSEGGCCPVCGSPYIRILEKGAPLEEQKAACGADRNGEYNGVAQKDYTSAKAQNASATKARILAGMVAKITVGWSPSCLCGEDNRLVGGPVPCTVLDPFGGAMTTGLVALQHGRNFLGVELNMDYLRLGRNRLAAYLETK